MAKLSSLVKHKLELNIGLKIIIYVFYVQLNNITCSMSLDNKRIKRSHTLSMITDGIKLINCWVTSMKLTKITMNPCRFAIYIYVVIYILSYVVNNNCNFRVPNCLASMILIYLVFVAIILVKIVCQKKKRKSNPYLYSGKKNGDKNV